MLYLYNNLLYIICLLLFLNNNSNQQILYLHIHFHIFLFVSYVLLLHLYVVLLYNNYILYLHYLLMIVMQLLKMVYMHHQLQNKLVLYFFPFKLPLLNYFRIYLLILNILLNLHQMHDILIYYALLLHSIV